MKQIRAPWTKCGTYRQRRSVKQILWFVKSKNQTFCFLSLWVWHLTEILLSVIAKTTCQIHTFHSYNGGGRVHYYKVVRCLARYSPRLREVINKKNCDKAVRLTASGGGGHPPPAWPLLFVKILGLFTHWIWFIDTQNRFYFIVKRLKNAFLMPF